MIASGFAILAAGPVAADTIVDDITFVPIGTATTTEPATVPADAVVGRFDDADNVAITSPTHALQVCGDPTFYTATIDWGDNATPTNGTVACDSSGTAQFQVTTNVSHTYKDSGTFKVNLSVTDTAADETSADTDTAQTATAVISDANISAVSNTLLRSEARNVEPFTEEAAALFSDSNTAFADASTVDPGLTATIDWGDGSTSTSTSASSGVTIEWPDCGECGGNVAVSGSHVYDANTPATKPFSVSITLHDDGGKTATSEAANTPAIADAALTADANKALTATATKSSTAVVGSFKDAAGSFAKAADFTTVSINWGDNTSSTGTVSQTASGAFSVSGTHTYAGAGTKSITATVTDEEGSSVTLHATATVAAAPVVLPATGQPHQPIAPGLPQLPIALLVLGLLGIAGGLAMNRFAGLRR